MPKSVTQSLTSSVYLLACFFYSTRYEVPKPVDFGYQTDTHYSKLVERGVIYHDDCMNHL
jgi:hypothetical protein